MDLTRVQSIGIETGVSFTGVTTVTSLNATQGANISLSSVGVAVTIVQSGTGGYVQVGTSSTVAVIDNSGRLLMGVASTTSDSRAVFQASSGSATGGANVFLQRGSTPASGEKLGLFAFADSEGKVGAEISAYADATWSLGDYPGRIVFSTTPDGSSTVTERLRIDDSGNLILASDTDTYIHHPAADTLAVTTGGSERMRIDSSGRMGLGTASPEDPLHVKSNSGAIRLENTVVANNDSTIAYDNTDLAFHVDPNNVRGSSSITFSGDGSERARIDSSGRLLVGTTSSSSASKFIVQGNASSGNYADMSISFNSAASSVSDGTTLGDLNFTDQSQNVFARIRAAGDGAGGTDDYPGRLQFYTTADGSSSPTERMRIDSQGRMGLGTTSPGALLNTRWTGSRIGSTGVHFATSHGDSTDYNLLKVSNSEGSVDGSTKFLIRGDGRVAIGTASPFGPLHVRFATNENIYFTNGIGEIGNVPGFQGINDAGSALTSIGMRGTDIRFATGSAERARIDSSGRLLIATSSPRSSFCASDVNPQVQLEGTNFNDSSISITRNANSTGIPAFFFGKTRGTSIGANGIVANGDELGSLEFQGNDGSKMVRAAMIRGGVDGTPGANDMPGRLVFYTTPDSANSPTERARIDKNGRLTVQYGGAVLREHVRADNANQFAHNVASTDVLWLNITTTSYAAAAYRANVYRTNTSAFSFAQFTSGNLGDDEFIFRGDGNGYADGSFSGGGADYAEYFEWSDGNTGAEDRRGISVVLDGDKIREAVAGEEPIGVISGNPSVVGDAAWNKWNGKYLRDDFGTYIRNAEGERQLNPDYNPDVEYISREDRPEWDCVGLMGKLRIRKGQVTGARWIKMRDISDNVEEWLVR